jgi:hypothetical protein
MLNFAIYDKPYDAFEKRIICHRSNRVLLVAEY